MALKGSQPQRSLNGLSQRRNVDHAVGAEFGFALDEAAYGLVFPSVFLNVLVLLLRLDGVRARVQEESAASRPHGRPCNPDHVCARCLALYQQRPLLLFMPHCDRALYEALRVCCQFLPGLESLCELGKSHRLWS